MLGLTLGFVICLLIGFVLWRFAFPKAKSSSELRKMALLSTLLAFFLIGLMLAAWRVNAYNRGVISAEPLTSGPALSNHDKRNAVVVGQISDIQPDAPDSPYAAYLRWPAIGDFDPDDIEYELPDLMLMVGDDGIVEVDGLAYDNINWPRSGDINNRIYEYIDQGDTVVVAGELYEGGSSTHSGLFLAPTFVFAGDYESFSAEYAPTLQATATYAQILQYSSLAAAILVLLSPLPQAIHLRRTQSG